MNPWGFSSPAWIVCLGYAAAGGGLCALPAAPRHFTPPSRCRNKFVSTGFAEEIAKVGSRDRVSLCRTPDVFRREP